MQTRTITDSRRIEGRAKVLGSARYVDDVDASAFGSTFDHAVVVTSTIGLGTVRAVDTTAALAVPGVLRVITHEDAPRLKSATSFSMSQLGDVLPLQDAAVAYYGQPIAVVVATTLLAAREGAGRVRVTYDDRSASAAFSIEQGRERLRPVKRAGMAPGRIVSGDAVGDFERCALRHDAVYNNAPHHHNTMEPGSAIARWDADGGVTVRAATQWHHIDTMAIAQCFGLGLADRLPGFLARKIVGRKIEGKVRLTNMLAGGAFGRNLNMVHVILACMAAKVHGRGVKLTVTRQQCFTLFSFRAEVEQRLRIGATGAGKLQTMIVDPAVGAGIGGSFVEPVGSWSFHIYDHVSRHLQHRVAKLDTQGPAWMRSPGGSSAMFALESAMDEIAHACEMDPLQMRLLNFAERDPESGKPWHNNRLRNCYEQGAAAIDWHGRPRGGTRRDDGRIVGYGMSTCWESHLRFPASVRVRLHRDGRATVYATVSEMGQGAWAALTTMAAQSLGLAREQVRLDTDGSHLPAGAGSVASTGTYSNAASVHEAALSIRAKLAAFAVSDPGCALHGQPASSVRIDDGRLIGAGDTAVAVSTVMARHPTGFIEASATSGRDFGRSKTKKATFGACFVEVSFDPITLEIHVDHMVGAFAGGRIIEPAIARNQLSGGLIWGLGQALMEQSFVDSRTGRWTNADLAEALIPTQADVRRITVITVDDDDPGDPIGMKGLSEISVMGPGPAIANAVFDALGTRVRHLPIRIDDLMGATS